MQASFNQRRKFVKDVINDSLLDDVVNWISSNMEPDEVFPKSDLELWAEKNNFVKKVEDNENQNRNQ